MYRSFSIAPIMPEENEEWDLDQNIQLRIIRLEQWLESQKKYKDRNMLYLVMYDIENNKVRGHIAKYLIRKGCLRIQKSIYLSKTNRITYDDICKTLKEINEIYENQDSILILPVPEDKFHNMKMIGKNVEFEVVTKSKNVLFF